MTIQKKAVEQCFPVVLFTVLYKAIPTFKSVDEILKYAFQMTSTEQDFGALWYIARGSSNF